MLDLNFRSVALEGIIARETTRGLRWCPAPEGLLTKTLVRCQESDGRSIDVDVTQNSAFLLCNRINNCRGLSLFQRPYPEYRYRRFFNWYLLPTFPVIPALFDCDDTSMQ